MLRQFFSKTHLKKIITHTIKLTIIVGSLLTINLLNPKTTLADCGQVYNSGGALGCYDTSYNEISPYVSCGSATTGSDVCCSNQNECDSLFPSPTPTPPGSSPTPTPKPSKYACGNWSLSENKCIGLDYNEVIGASKCQNNTSECCIDLNDCTSTDDLLGFNQYYCNSNGDCEDNCASGYESNCKYSGSTCISPSNFTKCIESSTNDDRNPSIAIPGKDCCTNYEIKSGTCNQINTAFGCLSTDPQEFTKQLLTFIIGIAGLVSIIMMIVGAIIFMTGGSNPEQVKRGKEIFTGAIIGLLFIIFSVVILQIIAGDIIQLPGFWNPQTVGGEPANVI